MKQQDRRAKGIEVEDATWAKLRELAQGYGVAGELGLS
jgi:LDH2 family malate/lactate/ureidoglycolate dehydrogenase